MYKLLVFQRQKVIREYKGRTQSEVFKAFGQNPVAADEWQLKFEQPALDIAVAAQQTVSYRNR